MDWKECALSPDASKKMCVGPISRSRTKWLPQKTGHICLNRKDATGDHATTPSSAHQSAAIHNDSKHGFMNRSKVSSETSRHQNNDLLRMVTFWSEGSRGGEHVSVGVVASSKTIFYILFAKPKSGARGFLLSHDFYRPKTTFFCFCFLTFQDLLY